MSDAATKIHRAIRGAEVLAGWPVVYASGLQGVPVPPRRWLWENWIPDRVVTLLTGDGGTGKSLMAMQLAVSVALGRDFMGVPMAPRRVLYLAAEDDLDELHRRTAAILEAEGADFADLDDRLVFRVVSGEEALLVTLDRQGRRLVATALYDNLRAWSRDNGAQVVIVDTAADTFGGVEIDRAQVTRFVRLLEAIARDTSGAVILVAHPSVAGIKDRTGISGSSAWRNASRSVLWLRKPDDDEATGQAKRDQRVLERMKANLAPAEGVLRVLWHEGRFVLDGDGETGAPNFDSLVIEAKVLNALRGAVDGGRQPSPSKNSVDYAARMLHGWPALRDLTISQIERALRSMAGKNETRVAVVGAPSRSRQVLVPASYGPLKGEQRADDLVAMAAEGGQHDASGD
jgi:archaellum biogenesis ATPase FlaH